MRGVVAVATVHVMATRTAGRRATERKGPSDAARELGLFIDELGMSVRAAARELDITHVFLGAVLRGESRPGDVLIDKIAVWSKNRVTRPMWRSKDEVEALAAQRPHRAAG